MYIILVIIIILLLLYFFSRKYYYFVHMRNKIFPIQMDQIKINADISTEKDYQRIISIIPQKLSKNELIFLLKYKKFVDLPNVYSMCYNEKINQLTKILVKVINEQISGSLIETGVWKGGMGMWMKCILKYYQDPRSIWLFDTYGYFPEPSHKTDALIHPITQLLFENAPSMEQVKNNFKKYGLLDSNIHFVQGEFRNTLNKVNPGNIAILRLDSDYYDSTMLVLESYYWKVVNGGYIIIDDYNNPYLACKQAVNDFRTKYNITTPIQDSNQESIYWKKE